MKNNVLIISTHPDDEVLGCGGTILKHLKNKDRLNWLIITNISKDQVFFKTNVTERQGEIEKVSKRFGFNKVFKLDFLPVQLNETMLPSLIDEIRPILSEIEPTIIYLPNRTDAHTDHQITFKAVIACTKSFRTPYIKKILMYECISETEFAPALPENIFIPNYLVDISAHLNEKISIFKLYKSEIGKHPFPRSIENIKALATFRGAIAGVQFAEAFQLIKFIDK
jgi:LmbE family N-acetylglucosaminyl deacetylase